MSPNMYFMSVSCLRYVQQYKQTEKLLARLHFFCYLTPSLNVTLGQKRDITEGSIMALGYNKSYLDLIDVAQFSFLSPHLTL